MMDKNWAELTSSERREVRFTQWANPEIDFPDATAAQAYKERVSRLIAAIQLKTPDRVPCVLPAGFFPASYSGISLKTAIYDYSELSRAWLKFLHDFDMDAYASPATVLAGRVFETLGFKQYKWPGYGLPSSAPSYQYVEGEYMKADEYDALIDDPSDFWMRVYLPRIFGALEPLKQLPSFTTVSEIPSYFFLPYARPGVQQALAVFIEAGNETARWAEAVRSYEKAALAAGFPALRGSIVKAPFDTMRGTKGIFMDMLRQPEKLLEALERVTKLIIKAAVATVDASGGRTVFMPLHKGDDAFMSEKHFESFYWPTLKKVVMGLVSEGIVPILFAEGRYDRRLDIINDLPRAAVIWQFDRTDMARAKKVLGSNACISGNVPTSLLVTGTPKAVKEYCRNLIESCGEGGGFILTGGANLDRGKAGNLRAMMEAVREYGIYNLK